LIPERVRVLRYGEAGDYCEKTQVRTGCRHNLIAWKESAVKERHDGSRTSIMEDGQYVDVRTDSPGSRMKRTSPGTILEALAYISVQCEGLVHSDSWLAFTVKV